MDRRGLGLTAAGMAALAATFGLAWAPTVAHAAPSTLWVSPAGTGGAGAGNTSCATAGYSKVSSAVSAASSGDTVDVCPGTYADAFAVVGKAVTINGNNGGVATIDAGSQGTVNHGAAIFLGPGSDGTMITSLTVKNARAQGIAAFGTSHITLSNNVVTANDQSCIPQTGPNDCGESIDIEDVSFSTVNGNTVTYGTGGILMSDGIPAGSIGATAFGFTTPAAGPTHDNLIEHNTIANNVWDCGITMPSHNSNAVGPTGPNQTASGGGIYNNTVLDNVITNNGTSGGGGAGIIMAGPFPGTGVYDNTIQGNTVSNNGEPGINLHSHAPGQDLNGNKIIGNTVLTNAIGQTNPGMGVFTRGTTSGDPDSGDPATTGIQIYSAAVPVTGTVITGNVIKNNHYGVVLDNAIASPSGNTTSSVAVPLYVVPAPDSGYALAGTDGSVLHLGNSPSWGSAAGQTSGAPVVGIAKTPIAGGYWLATDTGGVFSYGDAAFYGSLGGVKLNQPIVGMAATPDGHGYWLVAKDGGVFAFGDAVFKGSTGGIKLNQPVVGMASTSDGMGYWLVASDGGVFAFGDAKFMGSLGGVKLNKPIVGITSTTDDGGYWMAGSDGGVFAFGNAKFKGSTGGVALVQPVVGIVSTADDGGYWMVARDGGIFNYGNARYFGSGSGQEPSGVAGMYAS